MMPANGIDYFENEYIAALFLPHTDHKLFPSVQY